MPNFRNLTPDFRKLPLPVKPILEKVHNRSSKVSGAVFGLYGVDLGVAQEYVIIKHASAGKWRATATDCDGVHPADKLGLAGISSVHKGGPGTGKVYLILFKDRFLPMSLMKVDRYVQLALDNQWHKAHYLFSSISAPLLFQFFLFLQFSFVQRFYGKKDGEGCVVVRDMESDRAGRTAVDQDVEKSGGKAMSERVCNAVGIIRAVR